MSIVLNEYEWAENAIKNRELGKKPGETLTRVAKYYLHNGYSKKEAIGLLEDFILRCEPGDSVEKWSSTIDHVVKTAVKYPLVIIDKISVTKNEMQKINEVKSKQGRRLAFTLLCIAKYMNITKGTGYWVNTPDSEIMSMANINTSIKRQSLLFGQLREAGMIGFSKKIDNLSVQVLFADDSSEEAVTVSDFRNLGYQYLKACGDDYFECQCCGLTIKQKTGVGRKQKYCPSCAAKMKMQQTVNSVMRQRGPTQNDGKYKVYMHLFPDGKRYVGMTRNDLSRRWQCGRGYGSQVDVQSAIDKCGWDNVKHYVLFEDLDVSTARLYEALLIKEYKTTSSKYGYNTQFARYARDLESNSLPDGIRIVEVDGFGTEKSTKTINN